MANLEIMNSHPNTVNARKANGKALATHPNTAEGQKRGREKSVTSMNAHPNTIKARKKNAERGIKTMNGQKWQCTETGYISTAGPLSRYQIARGIDTSCRIKL
jgi:hypothetical protein